jgi:hypothetical protein
LMTIGDVKNHGPEKIASSRSLRLREYLNER